MRRMSFHGLLTALLVLSIAGPSPAFAAEPPAPAPSTPLQVELSGQIRVTPREVGTVVSVQGQAEPEPEIISDATVLLHTSEGRIVELEGLAESGQGEPMLQGEELSSGAAVTAVLTVPEQVRQAVAEQVVAENLELSSAQTAELVAETAETLDVPLPVAAASAAPVQAAATAMSHSVDVVYFNQAGSTARVPTAAEIAGPLGRLSTYWKNNTGGQINAVSYQTSNIKIQTVDWNVCDQNLAWEKGAALFGERSKNYWTQEAGRHLLVFVPAEACNGGGLGTVGNGIASGGLTWSVVDTGSSADYWDGVLFHEFGHNISLHHSNLRSCSAPAVDSALDGWGGLSNPSCSDLQYADVFDVMGGGQIVTDWNGGILLSNLNNVAELNVSHKAQLGSLGSDLRTVDVDSGGYEQTVTIQGAGAGLGTRGLRVVDPTSNEQLYIEYRSGGGRDANTFYTGFLAATGSDRIAPGVRVQRLYSKATGQFGPVNGSIGLQVQGGQQLHPYLRAGDQLRAHTGNVTISVISTTATTATIKVDFYQPFTTRPSPTISVDGGGTAWAGKTLTVTGADPNSWAPAATQVEYQWFRSGQAIPGATGAQFVPTPSDRGKQITVQATPYRHDYRPIPTTSTAVTPGGPTVDRIFGASRFETALEVSRRAFPGAAPVVYLATGANFPDALAAAPAAAKNGGPLLLAPATPGEVSAALIQRVQELNPARVVVVGGTKSLPESVVDVFREALPSDTSFQRISGENRYETAAALVRDAFPAQVSEVFVATGANFPDALSAAAVAGGRRVPVLLVDGAAPAVDAATMQLLSNTLRPSKITVVGAGAAVSEGILNQLARSFTVTRLAGQDRYETSAAINSANFTAAVPRVYVATGTNFADALSGAVLAAVNSAPLYVTQPHCMTPPLIARIVQKQSGNLTLIGGVASLSEDVAAMRRCS